MSWREKLLQASYMGIPFQVRGVEKSYPNLHAKHQYAGVDGAYFEPIQQDAAKFTVDAFVLGAQYMEDRDLLLEALRGNPSGVYEDPLSGGARFVAVRDVTVSEGVDEGMGFARISITFEESLLDPFAYSTPAVAPTPVTATRAQQLANAISRSAFGTALGAATEFTEGVADTILQVSDEIDTIRSAIYGPLSGFVLSLQVTAATLNTLEQSLTNLALAPEALWDQLTLVFETLTDLDFLDAFTRMHPEVLPETLADPGAQAANDAQVAVAKAVQQVALLQQGYSALSAPWTSADEALAARDRWVDQMLVVEATLEGDAYASWVDARVQVSASIEALSLTLPSLMTVTYDQPTSVLEIAQRWYQDVGRCQEIIDRNTSIVHPGFVVGSITLLQPGA